MKNFSINACLPVALPSTQSGVNQMQCFKLLDERVMAHDFDRQVAEFQVRAAILNRFTQIGTPTTVVT